MLGKVLVVQRKKAQVSSHYLYEALIVNTIEACFTDFNVEHCMWNNLYVTGKSKITTDVPGCKCGVEWHQNSGRKRRSTNSDSDNNRIIGGKKIDKETQMRKYPWLSLLWYRSTQNPSGYAGWAG